MSKDGYDHNICVNSNCKFIFVTPTPNNLREVYKNDLGISLDGFGSPFVRKKIELTKNVRFALSLIDLFKIRSVLDVGSRNGNFLLAMSNIGKVNLAIGIEPNTQAWQYCKRLGLDVRHGFFSKEIVDLKKFDLINMADVIEHVSDPRQMLREANELLNQNGFLLIRTPNLSSLWSKITLVISSALKLPWSSLTPPEHISNFSRANLVKFLESESFEIQSVYFEPPNLFYELGQLHLFKRLKIDKNISSFTKFIVGFSMYTLIFAFLKLVQPILRENFSQTFLVKKVSHSTH